MAAICYLNGKYLPLDLAMIPISDLGFIHGITVTEQLRTMGGTPFLLDRHLARFERGTDLIGIDLKESRVEITSIIDKLSREFQNEFAKTECGIGFFATPGSTGRFGQPATDPVFCVYCYKLAEKALGQMYREGIRLKVSPVHDVEPDSWPKNVKIRSRLHYYLAEKHLAEKNLAEEDEPGAETSAILVNKDGYFRDTPIAAPLFVFESGELTLPPENSILDSVSLRYVCELAEQLGLQVTRREIHRSEIESIRSMSLANSLFCLASVVELESIQLDRQSPELQSIKTLWKKMTATDFENCT